MAQDAPLLALVDDDADVRVALMRLVSSAGFAVETFASGAEFLRSVQDHEPDCVVLDLHMPEVSGFDVQVALASSHPAVPVVVMTGYDTPESRARACQLGARAYLCKPVNDEALLAAIGAAIGGAPCVPPDTGCSTKGSDDKIDITGLSIVDAAYSQDSAEKAVALVREGKAEALMKGSLHTDELMGAVVKRDTGLRTARRLSHCFIMDVPTYAETLIVSDCAINISPTMEDKVDIIQNAIDLAHALRFQEVRVAILSAMETVNPKVPSTIEAGALCKMADRGQITGGILDGPLALDNAISMESVAIKKINSPVAGRANVLIVPDLEAGNMLAKSLSFLAGADAAGIVLGARVPIILTSRADSVTTRLASCAIAVLVAAARREQVGKAVV